MKRMTTLLVALLFAAAFSVDSSAAAFMKLGDIKGEATDAQHEEWIELLSFTWGMETRVRPTSGLPTGKRQHKPISITKPVDKATPLLMAGLSDGGPIKDAEIHFTRQGRNGQETYLIVTLKDVYITSYSLGIDENGERPGEMMSLTYSEITWHYVDGGISHEDSWSSPKG